MNELKPCPFCGEQINCYQMKSAGYGEIICGNCGVVFRFILADSLNDVKEAWNRRANDE